MAGVGADSSNEGFDLLPDLANKRLKDILEKDDTALACAARRLFEEPDDYYAAFGNAPSPRLNRSSDGLGKR